MRQPIAFLHERLSRLTRLLLLFLLSACSPAPPEALLVGSIPWACYETLFLARELGYYDPKMVRLLEISTSTETLRAFRQGQLDLAALTLDETIRLAQSVEDLQIILVTNISNGADKLISHPEITSISALKGKRIGVEEGAVGSYMLFQALQHADLQLRDISPIASTVNQHVYLLQSGQVEAVVTFDPTAYRLEQAGFYRLLDSSMIEGKIIGVLVDRKATLADSPQAVEHLLRGYWQALSFLSDHAEQAYPLIAPRLGIESTVLKVIYADLIQPDKQSHQQFFQQQLPSVIAAHNSFMLRHEMIVTPANVAALLGSDD